MSDELFVLDDDIEAIVEPKKADEKPKAEAKPVVDAAELLKKTQADYEQRLQEERRRREEAEKLAAERGRDAQKLGAYATSTEYHVIANAMQAKQREAEAYERSLKEALEMGDAAKAAEFQRKMARVETELSKLEDGKAELEARVRSMNATEPEKDKPKDQTPDDYIDSMPPTSRAWLKEHREFVTDPKLHQKMLAYANVAVSEGITPHTPEFIEFLNDKLGLTVRDDAEAEGGTGIDEDVVAADKPVKQKPRATAAPVSRGRASISSINLSDLGPNTKIRFAPAAEKRFAATAAEMGMDLESYKRGVIKGIQEGKLPKNFADPDYTPGAN